MNFKYLVPATLVFVVLTVKDLNAQERSDSILLREARMALFENKDYQEAISLYSKLIQTDSSEAKILNELGIAYYRVNKYEKAIQLYNKAISLDSSYIPPYENRGNARADIGELKGALADLNYVVAKDYSYPTAIINRGRVVLDMGDTLGAISDFTKGIEAGYDGPEGYASRGISYWYLKNRDSAMADLEYAIREYPDFPYAYSNYGIVLIEALQQYGKAAEYLKKAVDLGQKDFKVFYLLAYSYQMDGDLKNSLKYYNSAARMDSTNSDVFYNLGTVHGYLGEMEQALENFSIALSLKPEAPDVLTNRALLVYDKTANFEQGIEDMREAISIVETTGGNPGYGYNNLGYFLYRNENYKEALKQVNYSIQLDSQNSYAYRNLSLIYKALDEPESACNAAAKAIELGFIQQYGDEIVSIQKSVCK